MEKHETELKSALLRQTKETMPRYIVQRHEDVRKSGIPDLSVDGNGHGQWWEIKHATPNFTTFEYQELMCLRLAVASYCRYLVYSEDKHGGSKRTLIIHPREVLGKHGHVRAMELEDWIDGYDHAWVCQFMIKRHYE